MPDNLDLEACRDVYAFGDWDSRANMVDKLIAEVQRLRSGPDVLDGEIFALRRVITNWAEATGYDNPCECGDCATCELLAMAHHIDE